MGPETTTVKSDRLAWGGRATRALVFSDCEFKVEASSFDILIGVAGMETGVTVWLAMLVGPSLSPGGLGVSKKLVLSSWITGTSTLVTFECKLGTVAMAASTLASIA